MEGLKGKDNVKDLLFYLYENPLNVCINSIVFTEVVFHTLSMYSSKSPITLKNNKKLTLVIENIEDVIRDILISVNSLPITKEIYDKSITYMKQYNLLPNDALILATCKHHNIKYLATLDEDFIKPAKKERIKMSKKDMEKM